MCIMLHIVFSCWLSAIFLDKIFQCVTFDATCKFYSCVALVFIVSNLCHMRFIYEKFWCYFTHSLDNFSSRVGLVVHRLFHNPNLLCQDGCPNTRALGSGAWHMTVLSHEMISCLVLSLISRSPTGATRWWGGSDRYGSRSSALLKDTVEALDDTLPGRLFQAGIVRIMADLSRGVLFAPGLLNFTLWYSPLELSEEPARVTRDA